MELKDTNDKVKEQQIWVPQQILYELEDCKSLLDLCAGKGTHLKEFEGRKIAIEIEEKYKPHLVENKYSVVHIATVNGSTLINMPNDYVDAVICIDGVEHLIKEDGLALIKQAERIAKKKVLFFTPNEFVSNEEISKEWEEPYQMHKSVFPKKFWLSKGYKMVYHEWNSANKINNNMYVKELE